MGWNGVDAYPEALKARGHVGHGAEGVFASGTPVCPCFLEIIEVRRYGAWELLHSGAPKRVGVSAPGVLLDCEEGNLQRGRALLSGSKFSTTRSALGEIRNPAFLQRHRGHLDTMLGLGIK